MKDVNTEIYIPIIRKKSPDTPIYTGKFNISLPFEPVPDMIFCLPTWDNQLITLKTIEVIREINSDCLYRIVLESITQLKFSRIKYSFDKENKDYEKYEINLIIPQLNLQTKVDKNVSLNPIPGIYLLTVRDSNDQHKCYYTKIKKTICNLGNQTINIELSVDEPDKKMKQDYLNNGWAKIKGA